MDVIPHWILIQPQWLFPSIKWRQMLTFQHSGMTRRGGQNGDSLVHGLLWRCVLAQQWPACFTCPKRWFSYGWSLMIFEVSVLDSTFAWTSDATHSTKPKTQQPKCLTCNSSHREIQQKCKQFVVGFKFPFLAIISRDYKNCFHEELKINQHGKSSKLWKNTEQLPGLYQVMLANHQVS